MVSPKRRRSHLEVRTQAHLIVIRDGLLRRISNQVQLLLLYRILAIIFLRHALAQFSVRGRRVVCSEPGKWQLVRCPALNRRVVLSQHTALILELLLLV